MKPVTLKIAGLHSFREEQVIPFGQLASRGVFGIFGSTGSGKSTVLDALTLALFGRVVRAKNKTQGILNTAEDKLTVSFLFELDTAQGKKKLRVDRKYSKKDTISVKHEHSRLIEIDGVGGDAVLAEGEGKVTGYVEALLGMKAEDFTRAVVLPQNKFAEFLTLDGSSKRKMLQRLFALERYGRVLTDRLQERVARTDSRLKSVAGELAGLGDASGETLAGAEKRAREAKGKAKAAEVKLKVAETQYEKTKRIWEWQEELKQVEKQKEAHGARAGEFLKVQLTLEAGERATQVVPLIQARDEALVKEEQGRAARDKAAALVQNCQARATACQDVYDTAGQRLEKEGPVLLEQKSALENALKIEQEVRGLEDQIQQSLEQRRVKIQAQGNSQKSIEQQEKVKASLLAEIRQVQENLARNKVTGAKREKVTVLKQEADLLVLAAKALEAAEKEVQMRQRVLVGAKQEREQTAKDLAGLVQRLADLRRREEEAVQPVNDEALAQWELQLLKIREGIEQLAQWGTHRQRKKSSVAGLAKELVRLESDWHKAGVSSEQISQGLALLNRQYQEAYLQNKRVLAAQLVGDLVAGAPCPVCGSKEHPQPAPLVVDETLGSGQLAKLRERIARGEKVAREATEKVNALAAAVSGTKAQLAVAEQDLERVEQEILALGGQLLGAGFVMPGDWTGAVQKWHREIEQRELQLKAKQKQLENWREERRAAQVLLNSLQEELTQKKARDAAAEQKIIAAQRELAGAKEVLNNTEADWEKANHKLRAALAELGLATEDGLKTARLAQEQLKKMDQAAETAGHRLEQLRASWDRCMEEIEASQRAKNAINADLSGLEARITEQQKQLAQKQEEVRAVTGGKPAATFLAEVKGILKDLQKSAQAARAAYEQAETKRIKAEQDLASSNTYLGEMVKRLEHSQRELAEALQKHQFTTAGEATDAFLDQGEMRTQRKRLEDYRDEGKRLEADRQRLQGLLGGAGVSPEQWLALQKELDEARVNKEQATRELIEADKEWRDLGQRHIRWRELEQQRRELDRESTHLETMKKLLRGDRFVQFLAHEQLEFVVRQATERLKKMTGGRYALLVDADSNFLIRDDANGSVKRPVTSLSGGETFQASLAMALALSTQIQLRGRHPLEFFFLDEGFGSLDENALETMVSTLEGLHLEQMTIGVISHVAELQQRIGCKLLVEPAQTGGRGSRVKLDFT